jgi:hypothetical protein
MTSGNGLRSAAHQSSDSHLPEGFAVVDSNTISNACLSIKEMCRHVPVQRILAEPSDVTQPSFGGDLSQPFDGGVADVTSLRCSQSVELPLEQIA